MVFVAMLLWLAVALIFHWRFQFSVRSLPVLMVAVALPCSWLAMKMKAGREQKESLDAVTTMSDYQAVVDIINPPPTEAPDAPAKVMVSVRYDYELDAYGDTIPGAKPPGPAWLSSVLGNDFFADVISLEVSNFQVAPATDALLEHLNGLDQLQELGLDFTEVTDAGLVHLKGLSQLQYLGARRYEGDGCRAGTSRRIDPTL